MNRLLLVLPLALLTARDCGPSATGFDQSHAAWTRILKDHVRGDEVDYGKLKEEVLRALDEYLASLALVMPEDFAGWKREQQYAYWINAYNAYTVKTVVDAYPLGSIRELSDKEKTVWQQPRVPLGHLFAEAGGEKLSLDDVEHKILRPRFKDARVHAAVNCASRGCPSLRAEAFVADRLEKQLDEQTRAWLSDEGRNRYDRSRRRIEISKVFEWFRDDFVRDAGSVRAWIARHGPEEAAWIEAGEDVEIEFLEYSWALNDAKE